MEIKSQLLLRVNGINITEVKLRHVLEDGHLHPDRREIEISDAAIGKFALTDEFIIEVKEKGNSWRVITVADLLAILTPR